MSREVELRTDGLEGLAHHLRRGGHQLDDQASTVPDVPDAGPCSEAVAAVLAWFADSASRLAGGAVTSGDSVLESVREYDRVDAESDAALRALGRR